MSDKILELLLEVDIVISGLEDTSDSFVVVIEILTEIVIEKNPIVKVRGEIIVNYRVFWTKTCQSEVSCVPRWLSLQRLQTSQLA